MDKKYSLISLARIYGINHFTAVKWAKQGKIKGVKKGKGKTNPYKINIKDFETFVDKLTTLNTKRGIIKLIKPFHRDFIN